MAALALETFKDDQRILIPSRGFGLAVLLVLAQACSSPPSPAVTDSKDTPGPQTSLDSGELVISPSPSPAGFVFAAKGDWGAGTPGQRAVTSRMCEARKIRPFKLVVTTGDNFYAPDGTATATNYHQPEACLLAFPGHTWRATWGNHDAGRNSTATELGAKERFYTWSEGNADFFMLDSNSTGDPAQTAWLEDRLRESKKPVRIVVFHHPPFTVGAHEQNAQALRLWVPLFERHRVTLVLTGHNHGYEHALVNGVDYVVTGGGGAQIYPCLSEEEWLIKCLAVHHFVLVDTRGPRPTVTALNQTGKEIDRFEVS